jgi:N-acetylneuraminic acid mutarotase
VATKRWKALGDAPIESRHDPAVAVCAGKIYVWGGINHQGGRVRDAAVLDVRTEAWQKIPDVPVVSDEDRVFYR